MSGAAFITRVVLENFKSIRSCDVSLGPLSFLVGPNGAGKSNFLDSLRFVSDGLTHSLDAAIRQRGGIKHIIHYPGGASASLGIRLDCDLPDYTRGYYAFRIGQSRTDTWAPRWEVLEEECFLTAPGSGQNPIFFKVKDGKVETHGGPGPEQFRDQLYLVQASGFPQFRQLYHTLSRMRFYQLEPKSIPDIDTFDPNQWLQSDGSNLASTLMALR